MAPKAGRSMLAAKVGQANCFFSTSRIAHELSALVKFNEENRSVLNEIGKMETGNWMKFARTTTSKLQHLLPLDEKEKVMVQQWILMDEASQEVVSEAQAALNRLYVIQGKCLLGSGSEAELIKASKECALLLADSVAEDAKENGVTAVDEGLIASLKKAEKLAEVQKYTLAIRDAVEIFKQRLEWDRGISMDDKDAQVQADSLAWAAKNHSNPIYRVVAGASHKLHLQQLQRRQDVRVGKAYTGFGDGGLTDWLRLYTAYFLMGIVGIKLGLLYYDLGMRGRGKDKWV